MTMPCEGILINKETLKIWAKEQGKELRNEAQRLLYGGVWNAMEYALYKLL